jgi:site-specific DNA-methyltransferase (adenine-specific)
MTMTTNEVITGDSIQVLQSLPTGCADLIFADPPFNIGYEYDVYRDRRSKHDYLAWTECWLAAAVRVLSPTGSMFVCIGDEFAAEYKIRLDAVGLTLRNWIVWHYTFGVSCTKKFNRSHAHIFYYVRNPKRFTFNGDAVRVPSARQTTYADRRANPFGKLPDDTWVLRPQESSVHFQPDCDTWAISRVCGTFRERTNHPCQMPEALLDRIIQVATNPGDLVLDPFAGSGTTLVVAKRHHRHYLGVELSEVYADGIRKRLQMIEFGANQLPQPIKRRHARISRHKVV